MRVWSQFAVVAVLALAGGTAWYYAGPGADDSQATRGPGAGRGRAVTVEVVPARRGTVTLSVEAVGTARANEAVTITPKMAAIVERIGFTEGQWVVAGDVLVELDANELKANLEEKRAVRDEARKLYDRARSLLKNRNVSQSRVDTLFAALQATEARVRADEARLGEYVIRAPFAGRLGLRRVSVGALVTPGTMITTLDDTSRIKVDFRVPATALAHVRPGLAIEARSASYPDRAFAGEVVTIDSRIDPVTRAIELRAHFANADGRLKPGMFLIAALSLATRDDAVLIPEEAVVASGNDHFVFTVVDGKAVKKSVTLGQRLEGEVEVLAGLIAGDTVVRGGIQKVRDGVAVNPAGGNQAAGAG